LFLVLLETNRIELDSLFVHFFLLMVFLLSNCSECLESARFITTAILLIQVLHTISMHHARIRF